MHKELSIAEIHELQATRAQQVYEALNIQSLATGKYSDTAVVNYIDRIINAYDIVEAEMDKAGYLLPLAKKSLQERVTQEAKNLVGLPALRASFFELHAGNNEGLDEVQRLSWLNNQTDFLDILEDIVPAKVARLEAEARQAFRESDYEEYSAKIQLLKQLGVTPILPEGFTPLVGKEQQPVLAQQELKFQRPQHVRNAVIGVGLSAIVFTGLASPAAAEESSPVVPDKPASISQTVETKPNVVVIATENNENPTIDSEQQEPTQEQATSLEITESTPKPEVAEKTVYTKEKALPTSVEIEDVVSDISNEQLKEEAPKKFSDVVDELEAQLKDRLERQNSVIKTGELAGVGEDTIFNMQDPFHPHKKLSMKLNAEQIAEFKGLVAQLNAVVEGSDLAIRAVLQEYADDPEYDAIMSNLALSFPSLDFMEGAADFTAAQKIAYLRLAQVIYFKQHDIAEQKYAQAQRAHRAYLRAQAKAESESEPEHETRGRHQKPVEYNENWDGKFESSSKIERIVDKWPLTNKGKKLMLQVIDAALKNADEKHYNPAVVIAQALVESGWMRSDLALEDFNFFGMKDGDDWDGRTVNKGTHENYNGKRVTKIGKFRSYGSASQGIRNYADKFIQKSVYADARKHYLSPELYIAGLLGGVNSRGEITKPQGATLGYATDPDYAYTLLSIIAQYRIDEIVPEHFLQGYNWDRKSNDNNVMPSSVRGKVYFNQHDKARANKPYRRANSPRNYTYESSACMPHSEAIVISNLTGKRVSPDKTVRFNLDRGFRTVDSGTSDASVPAIMKHYGLKARNIRLTSASFKKAIDAGGMIIVSGKDSDKNTPGTNSGHIYVVDDYAESNGKVRFYVLDPNNSRLSLRNYTFNSLRHDPKTGNSSMRTAWVVTKD